MAAQAGILSDSATALCLVCILMVPLAAAGLALVNAGFGRARSAAHAMLTAMCVFAVAVLVYLFIGFSLQGVAGGAAHVWILQGHAWNVLGAEPIMMRGVRWDGGVPSLAAALQLFALAFAATIPLGAGSDRWRLAACCFSTALLAAIVYPIFAHWIWAGGWLAQLGNLAGCGNGAVDAGGAAPIQALGGLAALAITWILGPRQGKYEATGMAIPAHNMPFVLFGCMLMLIGWTGLDGAAGMLFAGTPAGSIALIAINNAAAAAIALLAALVVTKMRYGKPDASMIANGFIVGLVSVSGACALVSPAIAAAIALVAGLMVPFSVEWLDRLGFDDPSGAISVHGLGGLWGVLATGLFVRQRPGQWLAQLTVVSVLLGFVLPLIYGLNRILDRIYPQRIAKDGERQGLDMCELGAGAYPEWTSGNKEHLFR
jgi:ammonium transporter, Amt family